MKRTNPGEINRLTSRWVIIAAVSVLLVVLISPFSSSKPDGLERVAEDQGFQDHAREGFRWSFMPDYELPGVTSKFLRTAVSGVLGISLLGAGLYVVGRWISRKEGGHHDGESVDGSESA